MTTNYDKAVEIYEAKGQSAVFDAVLNGTLTATSWHRCVPCECKSPHEGATCLVCGSENDPNELKAKIEILLDENHPAELSRLTGESDTLCYQIVHQIYRDGGLLEPQYWEAERVGDIWAIYGKTFAGEYIDAKGDCLAFDTKEEANKYIQEEIK
jgi:hypothetical protein